MEINEFLNEVCPIIKDRGWAYYFADSTAKLGQENGVDVLTLYFIGRGGVIGDVDAGMVISAFGYFKPDLIRQVWNAGREIINPKKAAALYFECANVFGQENFSGIDKMEEFAHAVEKVIEASDPTALALYAGAKEMELTSNPYGRAMQVMSVLREFRGSAHLLAVRAMGLETRVAHYLARPGDFSLFGWGENDVPEVSDHDFQLLRDAEDLTDKIVAPAYSVLNDKERSDLLEGAKNIADALDGNK